ncbi:MAG: hypothetical protein ACYS76_11410, partial [Planctomycetota bacterium]
KVQDNSAGGAFDRLWFYYGNHVSGFGSEILSPTFTSARMVTHLVGDTITVELDTDFDGMADQTYSRSGIPTALLGTGSGLGGYNNPLMDNFGVAAPMGASSSISVIAREAEFGSVSAEKQTKQLDPTLGSAVPATEPLTKDNIQQALQRSVSREAGEQVTVQWPSTDADQPGAVYETETIEIGPNANVSESTVTQMYLGPQASWAPVSPALSAASLVVEDFPSADSSVVGSVGFIDDTRIGHFWSATRGDSVTETFATGIPSVGQAIFDFVVPTNVLGMGNFVKWDVLINGVKIGSFIIVDEQIGPEHLEFTFPPIAGPDYTVRFEVTNNVPGGAGSHTLGYAGIHAGTVQLVQSMAEGCDNMDLGHPTLTPSLGSGIGAERSVAVDVNNTVTVTSLGIVVQMGKSTDLTVTIREVNGTVRGAILGSGTVPVTPGGPAFYDVPINFTFESGQRYDIGFNVTGGSWGTSKMEWYSFQNSALNPALGYDVGPFKVLDGGEWSGSGYPNSLLPHIRACAVPACPTTYDVYLGTEYPPATLVAADLTVPTWAATSLPSEMLDACVRYYWQVASRNCCDETVGPIWWLETEMVADLHKDHRTDFLDFALFSLGWLEVSCTEPSWCNGADLNYSGEVDQYDLDVFVNQWLQVCFSYDDVNSTDIAAMEDQMSTDKIDASDGNDFWPGTYLVYKTSQGRYGKFMVEDLDKSQNNQLTIGWVTYNADGSVYSSGSGLVIHGTWHCDLDEGLETGVDSDWMWSMQTPSTRYLLPEHGAKFKLMYRPH